MKNLWQMTRLEIAERLLLLAWQVFPKEHPDAPVLMVRLRSYWSNTAAVAHRHDAA